MLNTKDKAFRHPVVGRLYPGRAFQIGDVQFPSNWLELATPEEIAARGITVSHDLTLTPEDIAQEEAYQKQLRLREQATKEQFEMLGRFVQAFELMVDAVRAGCLFLTSWNGKQQQLMNIVFHHRSMTADPLFDIFRGMIMQIISDSDSNIKDDDKTVASDVLGQLHNRYRLLTQHRNDMLHGTWHIGWYAQADKEFQSILMHKGKVAPSVGIQFSQPAKSIGDISTKIADCEELEDMIRRLWLSFISRDTVSIAKQFKKIGDRWTAVVPGN